MLSEKISLVRNFLFFSQSLRKKVKSGFICQQSSALSENAALLWTLRRSQPSFPAPLSHHCPWPPPCIAGIVEVRRELVTVIDPFGIPPESGKLLLLLEKDVGVRIDSVKQVPASAELLLDVDKILQAIVREVAQCSC